MKLTSILSNLSTSAAIALILSASNTQAAVSITSVVNGSSAPVLDISYGTMELAFNLGSLAGGPLIRDGITFTNNGTTGTTSVTYGTSNGITAASSTTSGFSISNASIGGDSLYDTESYAAANQPMVLTLTGLDSSKSYRVQVMHADPRGFIYNNGTITATDSLAIFDTDFLTFGPGSTSNQYALVTFEVSNSTSLAYSMGTTATRGPSFAGVTVQSIPEPSTALLGGLGLLTLLRRRR